MKRNRICSLLSSYRLGALLGGKEGAHTSELREDKFAVRVSLTSDLSFLLSGSSSGRHQSTDKRPCTEWSPSLSLSLSLPVSCLSVSFPFPPHLPPHVQSLLTVGRDLTCHCKASAIRRVSHCPIPVPLAED